MNYPRIALVAAAGTLLCALTFQGIFAIVFLACVVVVIVLAAQKLRAGGLPVMPKAQQQQPQTHPPIVQQTGAEPSNDGTKCGRRRRDSGCAEGTYAGFRRVDRIQQTRSAKR
jgi:hypothetical protein